MEVNRQKVEALLEYFNQPSLTPKMIDEEFDQQGRDIGVQTAKNIINTRDQLQNQNGVGFTNLEEVDQAPGVGSTKFRLILEHFDLGDSSSSDSQNLGNTICISPEDLHDEIRKVLSADLGNSQGQDSLGSGPNFGDLLLTHQASLIGIPLPIFADAKTEATKLVLDQIIKSLKDKGNDDDGKTTADSSVTFSCETKNSATASGEGYNKEKFWWNVTKAERKKYNTVQKEAAKKAAKTALEVRLNMLKAFNCEAPCKKFFDVSYEKAVYSDFVWKGSFHTYVTWKCVIKAIVKYGCKS